MNLAEKNQDMISLEIDKGTRTIYFRRFNKGSKSKFPEDGRIYRYGKKAGKHSGLNVLITNSKKGEHESECK